MKSKKILTTIIFFILFINETKAQWNVISGSSTMLSAQAIYFLDANTGFEGGTNQIPGGSGLIAKTTNGGGSWITVFTQANNYILSFYFLNSTKGFAGGQQLLLKTNDGGNSWQPVSGLTVLSVIKTIHFADANTGYAAGSDVIYKTTDGGATWNMLPQIPGFAGPIEDIHFIDPATGFFVAADNTGLVYSTDDGGSTWDTTGTGGGNLYGLHFVDANTAYIVGMGGRIFKTTTAGASWVEQNSPITDILWDVKFINSTTGFATGYSKIIRTTNGGANWTVNADMPANFFNLYSIYFPTATTGYATGFGGVSVAKTTNAGGVGIEELNPFDELEISSTLVEEEFTITYDGPKKNTVINIYSVSGEVVTELEWSASGNEKRISVNNFSAGIYFVKVHDGKNFVVRKVMKM